VRQRTLHPFLVRRKLRPAWKQIHGDSALEK
jgi:hypothetical protein